MPTYGWQDDGFALLEDPFGRKKASWVTPNGAGKSSVLVAGAALSVVALYRRGKVVITSKDGRQLDEQVWPALERHRDRFPGWKFRDRSIETPTGGKIIAFTTDEPGRAEGWHKDGDTDSPLLMIVDEAKSVPDPIFDAFERCTYNWLFAVSSPGAKAGRFFDTQTKLAATWYTRRVGLADCPHIPKEKIEDIVRSYGENHPFTRSSVYGEFMDVENLEEYIFNVNALDRCLLNPPTILRQEHKIAFCDFGKGQAENSIAVRHGNELVALQSWREADEMASVGQHIVRFRQLGLSPDHIWGDSGGDIGAKMLSLLREAGWPVKGQNFGSPAWKPEIYVSWGSEAWHELARRVDKCEVKLLGDEVLRAQLTSRKHKLNNRGLLALEEKYDLAKRNIPSPDRADAVCGVFNVWPLQTQNERTLSIPSDWREQLAEFRQDESGDYLGGMDAGDG